MPVIMHPVGRGGYNRREDVICIQTALANAKISGHGSFWTGKICSAPGSLDTSLSHAAGLIEIAACHA